MSVFPSVGMFARTGLQLPVSHRIALRWQKVYVDIQLQSWSLKRTSDRMCRYYGEMSRRILSCQKSCKVLIQGVSHQLTRVITSLLVNYWLLWYEQQLFKQLTRSDFWPSIKINLILTNFKSIRMLKSALNFSPFAGRNALHHFLRVMRDVIPFTQAQNQNYYVSWVP